MIQSHPEDFSSPVDGHSPTDQHRAGESLHKEMLEEVVQQTLSTEIFDRQSEKLLERFQVIARQYPVDAPVTLPVVSQLVEAVCDETLQQFPSGRKSPVVQELIAHVAQSFLSSDATTRRCQQFWVKLQKSVR